LDSASFFQILPRSSRYGYLANLQGHRLDYAMNAQRRGGIYLVPGAETAALPPPNVASAAIRASALTPGSLSALKPFAIGPQHYQPGDFIDCDESPTLTEALIRFGYATRLPYAAVTPNRVSQGTRRSAKERLKKALAGVGLARTIKRT
jgi:hypothetical protein